MHTCTRIKMLRRIGVSQKFSSREKTDVIAGWLEIPRRVFAHPQFSSSLFQVAPSLSPREEGGGEWREGGNARESPFTRSGFSVVFSFAGKLDYYELAELVPQRRIFARTAYFLAHPLFGKSLTLQLSLPHSLPLPLHPPRPSLT